MIKASFWSDVEDEEVNLKFKILKLFGVYL